MTALINDDTRRFALVHVYPYGRQAHLNALSVTSFDLPFVIRVEKPMRIVCVFNAFATPSGLVQIRSCNNAVFIIKI